MSRITRAARTLARRHEAVASVVLFGSVACDRAVPSSDVDLLVVMRACDTPFLDRAAPFREYFLDLGVGADLFVYTEQEVAAGNIPIATQALRTGIVLYPPVPLEPDRVADGAHDHGRDRADRRTGTRPVASGRTARDVAGTCSAGERLNDA